MQMKEKTIRKQKGGWGGGVGGGVGWGGVGGLAVASQKNAKNEMK